jgi:ferritin
MSLLSVKFKLLKTSELLHKAFAHHFPEAADWVSNFQDSRGMLTVYGETPTGDFDASSHIELFEMFLEEFIKYQDMIEDVIDSCISEKDHMTKAFLDGYLLKLNPYIQSADNVLQVAKMYGTEPLGMQLFDTEIENCLVV